MDIFLDYKGFWNVSLTEITNDLEITVKSAIMLKKTNTVDSFLSDLVDVFNCLVLIVYEKKIFQ